jgi:hypothetical protein
VTPSGRADVGQGPADLDSRQIEDRLRLNHPDAFRKHRRRCNDVESVAKEFHRDSVRRGPSRVTDGHVNFARAKVQHGICSHKVKR